MDKFKLACDTIAQKQETIERLTAEVESLRITQAKVDRMNAIMYKYCLDGKPWIDSLHDALTAPDKEGGE